MRPWRGAAAPKGGHAIDLLQGGDALFPAMERALLDARHEVWLASYIVHTDAASERLLATLLRVAKAGVRVRLVVDGFGSRHALGWWRERLAGSSVVLAVFRPIDRWWHWFQPGQLRRMHLKLCVVDGHVAFVGGINLIDDRIDLHHGELPAARLDFAVRLEGPVVAEVERQLRRLWARSWLGRDFGDELRTLVFNPEPIRRAREWVQTRLTGLGSALQRARQQLLQRKQEPQDLSPVRVAYVLRDNLRNRHAIEREYLHALRGAQQRFDLICPYFYPSARLLRALMAAARRGVQVRLLLQGQADYKIARWAAQALYAALLARGVQVFEYEAAFLHAKVAAADDDWATVGSSNLDPTSLLLNLEANVVVYDEAFTAALRTAFEQALQGSRPVPPQAAPSGLRGWVQRLWVAWLAQVYLRAAGGDERY
jgi:cardiolipin synthase